MVCSIANATSKERDVTAEAIPSVRGLGDRIETTRDPDKDPNLRV